MNFEINSRESQIQNLETSQNPITYGSPISPNPINLTILTHKPSPLTDRALGLIRVTQGPEINPSPTQIIHSPKTIIPSAQSQNYTSLADPTPTAPSSPINDLEDISAAHLRTTYHLDEHNQETSEPVELEPEEEPIEIEEGEDETSYTADHEALLDQEVPGERDYNGPDPYSSYGYSTPVTWRYN